MRGCMNHPAVLKHTICDYLSSWEDDAVTASYAPAKFVNLLTIKETSAYTNTHVQTNATVMPTPDHHVFMLLHDLSYITIPLTQLVYCVSLWILFVILWQSLYDVCTYPDTVHEIIMYVCDVLCVLNEWMILSKQMSTFFKCW